MSHLSHFFVHLVDVAGYPGLFFVMLLGNIGVPVGTELITPTAGALVATGHLSSFWGAIIVAVLGEVAGASILYAVGYFGGRPFVDRYGKYVKLDEKKYNWLHAFYQRHGAKTVFLCRFIPVVRGVASLPAGVSQMSPWAFLGYTALGSLIFCWGLVYLGHTLGMHLAALAPWIHRLSLFVVLAIVLVLVLFLSRAIIRGRSKSAAP
ncbi:MAG TPA: DedA family protein [Candidatus Baltobacteraceae bacterium]|jgi:membrane protein DedA with SNARE-associated domain|nr:DedA family protein [Candidatus Baltobacteraceae bacterium]